MVIKCFFFCFVFCFHLYNPLSAFPLCFNHQLTYSLISASQSVIPSLRNVENRSTTIKNNRQLNHTTDAVNLSLKQIEYNETITTENSWYFIDWLSSVTENMNQKLTFELIKRKVFMVFHIPEKFFQLLKERIPSHYSKVEIINPPTESQGSYGEQYLYKYTWDITDIFNVKQIFDTSLVRCGFEYKTLQ